MNGEIEGMRRLAAAVTASILLSTTGLLEAQAQRPAEPLRPAEPARPPASQGGASLSGAEETSKRLAIMLEKLAKPESELKQEMSKTLELLRGAVEDIRNAEQVFDRWIKQVEDLAAFGAPGSEFMNLIDEAVQEARKDSLAARDRGNAKLQEIFESNARFFEDKKKEAAASHDRSFRIVRDIQREKADFVQGIKAKAYDVARENVSRGVALMKQVETSLENIKRELPEAGPRRPE